MNPNVTVTESLASKNHGYKRVEKNLRGNLDKSKATVIYTTSELKATAIYTTSISKSTVIYTTTKNIYTTSTLLT